MKEHPIIFSGPMVRAILDGRKTQTRRVIKPQPWQETATGPSGWYPAMGHPKAKHYGSENHLRKGLAIDFCPYGQPGDLLWVRETWAPCNCGWSSCPGWIYRANEEPSLPDVLWRPSIHMPRSASRLTLRITDVRVQRVQEISEEDARAEETTGLAGAMTGFPYLWESINAKRGYGWETNPWVWAISFERVTP